MRIVERLLYGIGGLLALVLLFIILCHFKPGIAKELGDTIQANAKETAAPVVEEKKETDTFDEATSTSGVVVLPISTKEYMAPAEAQLRIPSWAKEKSGLTPISVDANPVTEDEALEIPKKLGVGRDGKGLDFDALKYPYYHMLDMTGKAIYRQIYANANALIKDFAPIEAVSGRLLQNAFTAVVNDHPELFWVNTSYRYDYAPSGKVAGIYLSFNKTADSIDQAKQLFRTAADEILSGADELGTDYEREVYIHDRLISRVSYSVTSPMNQSAYSAMVLGKTVCAGYARAFQYLMQELGIPCYYCTGFAGENHAWNIIKLSDGYYNVDTTWDDTNPNTYLYFNCSDADYRKDHIRKDLSVKLPPCNGERYRRLELEEEKRDEKPVADKDEDKEGGSSSENQPTVMVLRSLESAGFEREDILKSIRAYYNDCSQKLVAENKNQYVFKNVVADGKIWEDIVKNYKDDDYMKSYMSRVLTEKHLSGCEVTVQGEPLSNGSVLLTHTITLW